MSIQENAAAGGEVYALTTLDFDGDPVTCTLSNEGAAFVWTPSAMASSTDPGKTMKINYIMISELSSCWRQMKQER